MRDKGQKYWNQKGSHDDMDKGVDGTDRVCIATRSKVKRHPPAAGKVIVRLLQQHRLPGNVKQSS